MYTKSCTLSLMRQHRYTIHLKWAGNLGLGTQSYKAYSRDFEVRAPGKPVFQGSADPAFRGSPEKYNPEEMLVAALSSCHKLWYLHLCAEAGITVTAYEDDASGLMAETKDGGGHFEWVRLRPKVSILESSALAQAQALHDRAHGLCFIANSCNFPVHCEPVILLADEQGS